MRRLNVKLVVWVSAVSVVTVIAVYFLHGWQMTRTARILKERGEEAENNGDVAEAVTFYSQYVAYQPDDVDAAERMAMIQADLATDIKPGEQLDGREVYRAFEALERVIIKDPSRLEARRRLIDFAMLIGQTSSAAEHIENILKNEPNNAELLTKLAKCQAQLGRYREADGTIRKAIEADPKLVDAYMLLAILQRDQQRDQAAAIKTIDTMVEANPENPDAYRYRAEFVANAYGRSQEPGAAERLEQRKADIQKAAELAPEDANVLLLVAGRFLEEREIEKARDTLQRARDLHPDDSRITQTLVSLKLSLGEDPSAELDDTKGDVNLQTTKFELALQNGDRDGAGKLMEELEKENRNHPRLEYMQARLDMSDGKVLEAAKQFERIRAAERGREAIIDRLLVACYGAMGDFDKQIAVYRRLIDANLGDANMHAGLGRALAASGNFQEAKTRLEAVKRAVGIDKFVASAPDRAAYAQVLLELNRQAPPEKRDWTEIDELIEATAKAFPDSKELFLLQAGALHAKGQIDEARQLIETALTKDPKQIEPWLTLAQLVRIVDGSQAALDVLARAREAVGDVFALEAFAISNAMSLPAEESEKAFDAVAARLSAYPPAEQDRLRRMLGQAYARAQKHDKARELFTTVAKENPTDPQAAFAMFEIAVREGNDPAMREAIAAIKKLYGPTSAETRYVEAQRLVTGVRTKTSTDVKADLDQARQYLRQATTQRPQWAVVPRLEAELNQLDGRMDDAIASLKKAVDLGDRQFPVVRQLTEWLVARGRANEAEPYLRMARAGAPSDSADSSNDMIEVSVALADNDLPRAIKLLEEAVAKSPDDARKMAWLGQTLHRGGRSEDAEKVLRDAVAKQPDLAIAWIELVRVLHDTKRDDQARAAIQEAQAKLPADSATLIAGQCHEMLGDKEEAAKLYTAARDAKPDDLGLTRALAMFYRRNGDREKAHAELRRLQDATPATDNDKEHVAWAKREEALRVASSGTHADLETAIGMLDRNELGDKVVIAELLSRRPDASSRLEAIKVLEEVKAQVALQPDGQMVLAQMYETTGQWPKCKAEVIELLGRVGDNPRYMSPFVEMLLRHDDDLTMAESLVTRLEQIDPTVPRTIALKGAVLAKQGKPEEAVAILRGMLPRPLPRERQGMLLEIARLLEDLDQTTAAEEMYLEFRALQPKATLLVAGFYGRHGQLKRALDLCEESLEMHEAEQVINEGLQALRNAGKSATKEDYSRVETWIGRGVARNPNAVLLQLLYTELLDAQGRYAELEEQLRRILQMPDLPVGNRAIVLNNLAYLLAAQGKTGDSRALIDETMRITGPVSNVLDTRALVHLAHGEGADAVRDMRTAVIDEPTGMKYFHLAMAQQAVNDVPAATDAMRRAIDDYGLKLADIPPLEQSKFRQLLRDLRLEEEQPMP